MKPKKILFLITILILLSFSLIACGGGTEENTEADMATAVAKAVTEMAGEIENAPPPETEEAEVEILAGDMNPLTAAECDELATAMEQTLELMVASENVPVTMSWSGEMGGACQMTALANGNNFSSAREPSGAMQGMLDSRGWWGGDMYMPCLGHGGAGPAADQSCYFSEKKVCEVMVTHNPMDMSLCEEIEGDIGACLAAIAPEQRLIKIVLTCAQGNQAMPTIKTEPERIQFAAGAISAQVQGSLAPNGLSPYVLNAMAGQEMTVNLTATGAASLSIWGLDGTVLISNHADATSWVGLLPLTQDYYIDVISLDGAMIDYTLEVILPPVSNTLSSQVFPDIEPFNAGDMMPLSTTGVPLILPPDFPISGDLPAILPYAYDIGQNFYEISLDYGADCHGAGACHYGSLMGSGVNASLPVGTEYFPFDIAQSRMVTLEKGITGYFVESVCGANCSDAQVFWIYGGYQYMLGLKGGAESNVVALVNAAILNSVP